MAASDRPRPHVVIVGAGFGGLAAARRLAGAPVEVTVIDRRNHHLFQPLLYQVATAALSPGDIAVPIRAPLRRQRNARVLLAEVQGIDPATRTVTLDDGALRYDYLIVATGATHSYFGKPWQDVAPGLKSIEDALEIRRRVFLAYEAAEREQDAAAQRAWLTFVVVGAGPTGVELAGALGEIGLHTLAHDFRRIDPRGVRVLLLEGNDRILGTYPVALAAKAVRSLEARRVEVRTSARVTAIDRDGVELTTASGTERVAARTVLWAAGVQASPLGALLGAPIDRSGRVEVDAALAVAAHPEVFVIGDLARAKLGPGATADVPGVAQGALQGGRFVADIIAGETRATAAGRAAPRRPAFRYRDKGQMATVGRKVAVVQTRRVALHGFIAWMMWWVVHVIALVGFRNRAAVTLQWAWHWLTFQRGARLITGEVHGLPRIGEAADGLPTAAAAVSLPTSSDA